MFIAYGLFAGMILVVEEKEKSTEDNNPFVFYRAVNQFLECMSHNRIEEEPKVTPRKTEKSIIIYN